MQARRVARGAIEYALLGFLEREPLHGYEVHQRLQAARALGLVWHVKQPQLYALLGKLEAAGLIAAEVVPQGSRPPKRLLQLTPTGQATFTGWLAAPVPHGRDIRIEFLAKLFWVQGRNAATMQQLIAQQRDVTHLRLAEVESELVAQSADQPYAALVLQFRQGQLKAVLAWLDACAATLVPVPA